MTFNKFRGAILLTIPLIWVFSGFDILQQDPEINHAKIIQNWDKEAFKRGESIYRQNCMQCHGDGENPLNPTAISFTDDSLKNGNDPYSIWQTLTKGYKMMPSQSWLSPRERYDVVHYLREAFFKEDNPEAYTKITEEYLAQLPGGTLEEEEETVQPKQMDYGTALTYELESNRSALILDLPEGIHLYYDLHTMSIPAVWQDGYVNLDKTHHTEYKGGERAKIAGTKIRLGSMQWAYNHSFEDPRHGDEKLGPVSDKLIAFKGHYLHGDQAILNYKVLGRDICDQPSVEHYQGKQFITHTLHIGPGQSAIQLSLEQGAPSTGRIYTLKGQAQNKLIAPAKGNLAAIGRDTIIMAGVAGAPENAHFDLSQNGRLVLDIPSKTSPMLIKIFRVATTESGSTATKLGDLIQKASSLKDPVALTQGGPGRWQKQLSTSGKLGKEEGAYALDSLGIPFQNPWDSWMRPTAIDFFKDGRGAVSTLNGDVWIISGIDQSLEEQTWERFATGLYEPLGLEIVDGTIYVQGRDRITRLRDLNDDGEADYYDNFYDYDYVSRGYHAFTFGLDTDSKGNFYTALSGRKTETPIPGFVLKISPDGKSSEIIATGFRHPNGLAIGPDDGIYISDNQGGWIPAPKISRVEKGKFYGYPGWEKHFEPHDDFEPPVFWLPQEEDNSSGGPVWPMDERFGPLAGHMLHLSYGAARAFYTSFQNIENTLQGSAVAFPWQFPSGLMRGAVNPRDGQVYVVGQIGWGTKGKTDGSFNRIRYTGKDAHVALGASVTPEGVQINFTSPLKASSAKEISNYTVKRWEYKWSENYGSPHYLPGTDSAYSTEGEEEVNITGVNLAQDRKSVELQFEKHITVDQMEVQLDLEAEDGTPIQQTVFLTIKVIPEKGSGWEEKASRSLPK